MADEYTSEIVEDDLVQNCVTVATRVVSRLAVAELLLFRFFQPRLPIMLLRWASTWPEVPELRQEISR